MKKDNKALIVLSGILGFLLIFGAFLFKADYVYVFKFWISLLVVGIIFFPLASIVFKKFHDNGWIFSKVLGVAISGWLIWIISYMKILKFTMWNCYIILFLLAIASVILYKKKPVKITKYKIKNILVTEIAFVILLFGWTYIRGLEPDIDYVTEKYMNYGFMNSMLASDYMPAEDIWLSGYSINYYYFGQYIASYLCRIACLPVSAGYNLMVAFVASMLFVMPATIGYNLIRRILSKNKTDNKVLPILLAFLIGFSICLGGTLHFPIYKFISPDKDNYFYADATRYIGYKPTTNDQVATELPAYSSIIGDLHAHFMDTMFAFTTLAILLQYFLQHKKYTLKSNLLNPHVILLGFMLGLHRMTNIWDFPIYIVVISLIIAIKNIIQNRFNLQTLKSVILTILEVLIIQTIVSLPFALDLSISSIDVCLAEMSSPLYKLLVLWGLPIFCVISFFILFVYRYVKGINKKDIWKYLSTNSANLFALILGICAIGLIIIPELVYVKDIYVDPYRRFNTVFKLTFEAYIMLSISANYCIVKFLLADKKPLRIFGMVLLLVNLSTFGYGIDTIMYKHSNHDYVGITQTENAIRNELPDDYEAIQWIKENIQNQCVILQSASYSSSYTANGLVSVFTGNPTVLGWHAHEWIWRSTKDYQAPVELGIRYNDIAQIYTGTSKNNVQALLRKYNVSYIYIGAIEEQNYSNINYNLLFELGTVVYNKNNVYIIKVQ